MMLGKAITLIDMESVVSVLSCLISMGSQLQYVTIMLSDKCPVIVEQVMVIVMTCQITIVTV